MAKGFSPGSRPVNDRTDSKASPIRAEYTKACQSGSFVRGASAAVSVATVAVLAATADTAALRHLK